MSSGLHAWNQKETKGGADGYYSYGETSVGVAFELDVS